MVALYVLETAPVDELWLVPAWVARASASRWRRSRIAWRCASARRPALGPRVKVSDIEQTLGGESRTLRTVRRLQQLFPDHVFSLVIGADLARRGPDLDGADELRATVPFIVVGRGGAPAPGGGLAMPEVSSTAVREALAANRSVEGLVPRAVLHYIYDRGALPEALDSPSP